MFPDILKDELLLWFIVTLFPSNINMICVNYIPEAYFRNIMAHSIPRMPIPPGICHFVLEKLQMPRGGGRAVHTNPNVELKTRLQMPYPGATPVIKLQMPSL